MIYMKNISKTKNKVFFRFKSFSRNVYINVKIYQMYITTMAKCFEQKFICYSQARFIIFDDSSNCTREMLLIELSYI